MCIDLHQTGFVGKGSDHLQLIKFWPSWVCSAVEIFGSALLQPARSVCVSLSASLYLLHCMLSLAAQCIVIGPVCGFVAVFVCLFVCLLPR